MKFSKIISLFAGIVAFSGLTFLSLWLPQFKAPEFVAATSTVWFFPAFTIASGILCNAMWYSFKYAIKVEPTKPAILKPAPAADQISKETVDNNA